MTQIDISKLSLKEIFNLYADLIEELRSRQVVRSSNNPVADFAETLAAKVLGLKKATLSTKGFDAVDENGMTYEIKSRRITKHNRSRQLSAIRKLDEKHFDFLVGILFNPDFSVKRVCIMPYEAVKRVATYKAHTNSWIVQLRDEVWENPGVRDVTAVFRQAAET
jgi:hypothetical protein